MTATNPPRSLFNLLLWPSTLVFILLSLALAVRWLIDQDVTADFLFALAAPADLLLALLFQIITLLLLIIAWHLNLRQHGLRPLSWFQSSLMVGINAIGKYTPGKIWGMVARGSAVFRLAGDKKLAIQSTFVEQLAMLHGGAILLLLAVLAEWQYWVLFWCALIMSAISVWAVAHSAQLVLSLYEKLRRNVDLAVLSEDHRFYRSYVPVLLLMCIAWLTTAVALHYCLSASGTDSVISFASLLQITTLAYLAGFVALFAQAGLGVREGVMTAMLTSSIGLPAALSVALFHRLATLLPDLVLGILALVKSKAYLMVVEPDHE